MLWDSLELWNQTQLCVFPGLRESVRWALPRILVLCGITCSSFCFASHSLVCSSSWLWAVACTLAALPVPAAGVALLSVAHLLLVFTGTTSQLVPSSKNYSLSVSLLGNEHLLMQKHNGKCQVILNLAGSGEVQRKPCNRNNFYEGEPSQTFNSSSSYGFIM